MRFCSKLWAQVDGLPLLLANPFCRRIRYFPFGESILFTEAILFDRDPASRCTSKGDCGLSELTIPFVRQTGKK